MNSDTEVKVLDLATFGDLSDALQNFAADGRDISARFLSYLEMQVADMEEVCSELYARMREAEAQLEAARSAEYAAQSAWSYCESQVYTSYSYDDEGNSYEETIYPDCSAESDYLSHCEEARYEAAKIYEAAEELYTQGRSLLTAAQECVSNFQGYLSAQFYPLLNNHTPAACRKISAIATDLYGYLDARFGTQPVTSNLGGFSNHVAASTHQTSNFQTTKPPATVPGGSKPVVQEVNDQFNLTFQDKLGRNVQAAWKYKEGELVAFESLTCDGKNVMQHPGPVQFTIQLEKGFDSEKNVEFVNKRTMRINTIYLLDEYQGSGIGGEIVRQLENLARQKGCRWIEGTAENDQAKAFFSKLGFSFEANSNHFKKILSSNSSMNSHEH